MAASGVMEKLDAVQKQHRPAGVAVATFKKFQEDRSTRLASIMAFWAFFSIFPLLLVFVSVLGYVLPASIKSQVLHHVAAMFPLLNPSTVGSLSGSVWSIVVGGVTAVWSGLSVMRSTEWAFNTVWEIPENERPKQVKQILGALKALATIGLGLVLSTIISGFITGKDNGVNLGIAGHIAGYVIAAALDIGLFLAAFRMLTDRKVTNRDVLPGAVLSGVVFWVLEQLSSFIISRHLHSTQSTYGNFATVITILWWFYLQAVVTLLGAQLNVVLHERLYPRALTGRHTDADKRVLHSFARSRSYEDDEKVHTEIPDEPPNREA